MMTVKSFEYKTVKTNPDVRDLDVGTFILTDKHVLVVKGHGHFVRFTPIANDPSGFNTDFYEHYWGKPIKVFGPGDELTLTF